MMEGLNKNLLVNLDELEPFCVAMRSRTSIIYLYPFQKVVWKNGAKIITRDGRVVKKLRMGGSGGVDVIVGILDGEELRWDAAGRFYGPYKDSPLDLMFPERYAYRNWKEHIGMSNAEWAVNFGRPHPGVKMPKRDN